MLKKNLKPYTFIDGDFSMEISVSEEERTIYLNKTELANLLGIHRATITKYLNKKIADSKWDSVAENEQNGNKVLPSVSAELDFEIIKDIGQKYNPERIEKLENWLYDLFPENDIDIIDGDYEIVRYNQDNLNMSIVYDPIAKTPWLTQKQMSKIFGTSIQDVSYHIANIFEDQELDKNSVIKDYLNTAGDGKTYKTTVYNLDMIFAVGYRVRTAKAIQFRKWVTSIVEKHLVTNYITSGALVNINDYLLNKFETIDNEITKVRQELDELKPKNKIFYKEQGFDAYIFLSIFIATAKNEVFIIDPYADRFTMSLLNIINDKVNVIIVLSKYGQIDNEQLELFKKSHPSSSIELIRNDDEHDRHIFVDRKYGYIVGSSLNSFSYHDFSVIKIDDVNYIKEKIAPYNKKDA